MVFRGHIYSTDKPQASSLEVEVLTQTQDKMDTMLKVSVEQLKKVPMLVSESTCSGKTYIVTGSNTGLGLETARHLVQFAASRVILAVRNMTAGETAQKDIEKSTGRQGIVEVSMRV